MRYISILIIFVMMQHLYSQNTNRELTNDSITLSMLSKFTDMKELCNYHLIEKEYKVWKIRHLKNAYLIHITDSSQECFFTIISLKSKVKPGKRIKKGKTYNLKLESYYPHEPDVTILESLRQSFFEINGIVVYIPLKISRGTMVTTTDLQGLYYIRRPLKISK